MKTLSFKKTQQGFTLIELLVVAALIGFVMTALYSLYTSHQRAAYTNDETVEVQQNLRIAIDSLSRDIRSAGLILQTSGTITTAVSAGTTSSTIYISSSCPSGILTRITPSPSPQKGNAVSPNIFTVDNDGSLSAFAINDFVRIITPTTKTQPGGVNRIYQVTANPAGNLITLTTVSGTEPNGVDFNTGDVICKLSSFATPAPPNTVRYYIGNPAGGTCPTGQQCLIKVDETGSSNVIAQNMSKNGLLFQYLLNRMPLPNETTSPTSADFGAVRAVRVTVLGQTVTTVALSSKQTKTRQLESLIQIRNR